MAKLAILDIGTNSIHLVLAEVESDFSYKIVDRLKDITRLGDGAFVARRLSDSAMTRGLEVIRNLVRLARNRGFERIEAVATSAVREARNGGQFLEQIARETRLTVRVITGSEEARLIFLGVQHSMTLSERPILVVDVGGGSVELIAGNRDGLMRGCSLKLGAIRLKDLYLQRNANSKSMHKQMRDLIRTHLEDAFKDFRRTRFDRIVATSGMAGNLAEVIHLERTGRPLPQLNLATVARKDLEAMEVRLARSGQKARLAIPGIDPKRADTLFPAAAVLRMVLDLCEAEELTISDKAIREGVIYDFIQRHREKIRAEREIPDVRRRNVIGLARRCQVPLHHGEHVAKLALQLFDQTRTVHGYGRKEREWLEYAALLHDVGYMINPRQHHKHTYYLIKHSPLSGFQSEELEIIANVARYHRRSHPHKRHVSFGALSGAIRRVIEILSAMLRVADGLDRSHFAVVRNLQVRLGTTITIALHTVGDVELELWAAEGRADLLEKILERKIQFVKIHAKGAAA